MKITRKYGEYFKFVFLLFIIYLHIYVNGDFSQQNHKEKQKKIK